MTESEIKIWNEAIDQALNQIVVAGSVGAAHSRVKDLQKPEPGDLSEDELKTLSEHASGRYGMAWDLVPRLITEVERRRRQERDEVIARIKEGWKNPVIVKEQPESPKHKHEWRWGTAYEPMSKGITIYHCSCGATKTERIEESK